MEMLPKYACASMAAATEKVSTISCNIILITAIITNSNFNNTQMQTSV
jgi:hypothetical protein